MNSKFAIWSTQIAIKNGKFCSFNPLMEANPLPYLLKKLTLHTRHLHSHLRRRDISPDSDSDSDSGGSVLFKDFLTFQRPTTVNYRDRPMNSTSFIGKIIYPLKKINTRDASRVGFHTILEPLQSSQNSRPFQIMIMMWDEIPEVSMQQLKPNDLVNVWGPLETYTKSDQHGKPTLLYKVIVKEINYVARDDQEPNFPESERIVLSGDEKMEKYRNKLHLWQVFLCSPHEWRDYRKSKKNPRHPDFKHKDTGESLWIDPQDPPWIKRQLQLIDSRMDEQGSQYYGTSSSGLSPMVYDDAEEL